MELAQTAGSTVFDVRSESEFIQGHYPGAIHFPLLNDEQRKAVGIAYKQEGQSAAVELGFELVGPQFAEKIKKAKAIAGDKTILVYCWRGGLRSNIMAWLLQTAGLNVALVIGGYKAIRHYLIDSFNNTMRLHVVSGKTGVGKTEVLRKIHDSNIHFVDLEALAMHRGSAFGGLGLPNQPTQEQFENNLGFTLRNIPNDHSVLIEDESRMIGKVRIPDAIYHQMEKAPLIELIASDNFRIEHILGEYGTFETEILVEKTHQLQKRMGPEQCKLAITALQENNKNEWCRILLHYYDKAYHHKFTEHPRDIGVHVNSEALDVVDQIIAHITHERNKTYGI